MRTGGFSRLAVQDVVLRFFHSIVRFPSGGRILGAVIARASWLVPGRRLAETETLLVLAHPRPCYPFHALALLKADVGGFLSLDAVGMERFAADLEKALPDLFRVSGSDRLWLVINGGTRQDVAQFHAHVVRLPDGRGSLGDRLRSSTLSAAFAEARAILERRRGWRGYSFQAEIRAETGGAVSAWLIRDGLNPAAR